MTQAPKRGLGGLLTPLPGSKRAKTGQQPDEKNPYDTSSGYVQGPLDPVFGQRSAFPVVIDVAGVELGKEPADVNEYLAQVRLEACSTPAADAVARPVCSDSTDPDDRVFYRASEHPPTEQLVVPTPLLHEYLADFNRRRHEYNAYRMRLHELDAIDLPQSAREWKRLVWDVRCERAHVAQLIEEDEHVKLLVYFAKWLSLNVNDNFRTWLFGVLDAIEDVLLPAELSVVRQLGKKALRQLHVARTLPDHAADVDVFSRLLVIVGLFYKQRDLLRDPGV